jgi:hypothetical protein
MRKPLHIVEILVIAFIFLLIGLVAYGSYLNQTDMAERDPAAYDRYSQCLKLGGTVSRCAAAATMPTAAPPPEAPAAPAELAQPSAPPASPASPAPATP